MKIYLARLLEGRTDWPMWLSPMTALTASQTAAFLGIDRRTLWRWGHAGIGPQALPSERTQWRVKWYQAHEVIRWREAQLGTPVPSVDELMEQHYDFMRKVGLPPVSRTCSLSLRPFKYLESWRPKGMRRCKRRRLIKSREYSEIRRTKL
jgi:hypothetical protein